MASLRFNLQSREPEIDAQRLPDDLQCQECGCYHASVDPFILLCIDCEVKLERMQNVGPIRRSIAYY
jgi:hypothetical protein